MRGQTKVLGTEIFQRCQELRGREGLLGLGPLPSLGHEHALLEDGQIDPTLFPIGDVHTCQKKSDRLRDPTL